MTSNCRDWYLDFDTKQDCLDNQKFSEIPVDLGESTTEIAKISTTEPITEIVPTKTSTTRRTTGTTTMTVTILFTHSL